MTPAYALPATTSPAPQQTTSPFPFEDRSTSYNSSTGYWETNEEPELHRSLLKGKTYRKAAAVASAGEISLLTVLPLVTEKLVLVDHSYASMAIAMLKARLLTQLGAAKAKKLLIEGTFADIKAKFQELAKDLPQKLRAELEDGSYGFRQLYSNDSLRREWHFVPLDNIKLAAKRLPLVSFIHGDFADLKDQAPFDFLYTSNAFDYSGRIGRPTMESIAPLIRRGGDLLLTSGSSQALPNTEKCAGFHRIKCVKGFRTEWYHAMYQKGE